MNCHDTQLMIAGFIEQRLTDQQLEDFIDHIAGCQDCYDELEVYYMITTGLMLLDEDHTGTLDLRKSLKDFIAEQRRELYARKRMDKRKKRITWSVSAAMMFVILFLGYIFVTSKEGIHSIEDFQAAAMSTIQKCWFSQTEETEDPETGITDPIERRKNFELQHPLIPSYFSNLMPAEPEYRDIIEKDR